MLCAQSVFDEQQVADLQRAHSQIWVAYSGGMDSHVLLNVALKSFNNVQAIHINHKQSVADDIWQTHCAQICRELQVTLHCVAVDLKCYAGQSMELAARNARRAAWQQTLSAGDLLLLGHHADDQAETILYRLLRGSGPRGLVGMQQASKLGQITLLRPFLNYSKQELLQYAQAENLHWLEDHTNACMDMDRNFLRMQILPVLQTRWPKLKQNINRTGKICKQLLQHLDPHLHADLQSMVSASDKTLDLKLLIQHEQSWQAELLRAWLLMHGLYPSAKQISILMQQVIEARQDANPQLQIGSKYIRRAQQKLFVLAKDENSITPYALAWDISQPLLLPDGQKIYAQQVFKDHKQIATLETQAITVRVGHLGQKAKKIFQQNAVPPWERYKFPLVFADKRLVSIVGLWNSPRI